MPFSSDVSNLGQDQDQSAVPHEQHADCSPETLAKINTALFQFQKMDQLGQLTSTIAHDFNNLLSIIATGLEVFELGALDARQQRMVDSMKKAIEKGTALTQQLSNVAKPAAITQTTHHINDLIYALEPQLRKTAGAAIHLIVDLQTEMPLAKLDATGFETAILNLIANAIEAMPEGGSIKLKTEAVQLAADAVGTLPEGLYIKVSVEDNGVGISPEVLPHIVKPFYTGKENDSASGLGLSQAHGFIVQAKGDMAIASQVGVGTRVSLFIPAIAPQQEQEVFSLQGHSKVLIVDDEPELLIAATELFRSMGYIVLTACSAEEAMEKLWHAQDINLLFADILMPGGMNGIQLAREVRQFNPQIKVILASAYPLPVLKAQHGNMDEFSFLSKPYRLADIAQCLSLEHA